MFDELVNEDNRYPPSFHYPMDSETYEHFDALLDGKFGSEYSHLTLALQMLLIVDVATCDRSERDEYRQNIGFGNLASYARSLASQLRWTS